MGNNKIKLELTQQEGLVLMEFLQELDDNELIKRNSDKRIIWDLICMLEKQVEGTINNPNYGRDLEKAREELGKNVENNN